MSHPKALDRKVLRILGENGGSNTLGVRRPTRMLWLAVSALVGWPGVVVGQEVDCSEWNSWGFFNDLTADDVRDCLEAGADVNARDEFGNTPLHETAGRGNVASVGILLEAGADVMVRNGKGETPLFRTAGSPFGNVASVRLLVEAGADVMARDRSGRTPLHAATDLAAMGLTAGLAGTYVMSALIQVGATVDASDQFGRTPLHTAAISEGLRVNSYNPGVASRVLLEAGAEVDSRSIRGNSPLHYAAQGGVSTAIMILLNAGANPRTRNQSGKTPWDLARERGETDDDFKTSKAYWRLYELNFPGEGIDEESPTETGDTT